MSSNSSNNNSNKSNNLNISCASSTSSSTTSFTFLAPNPNNPVHPNNHKSPTTQNKTINNQHQQHNEDNNNNNNNFEQSNEYLRNQLLEIILIENIQKNKLNICKEYEQCFKTFEISILAYIREIPNLCSLLNMANEQDVTHRFHMALKKCELKIDAVNEQFQCLTQIIEMLTERWNVDYKSIQQLKSHENRIKQLHDQLNEFLITFNNNNNSSSSSSSSSAPSKTHQTSQTVKLLRQLINQLLSISQKYNSISNKIPELTEQTLKYSSAYCHRQMTTMMNQSISSSSPVSTDDNNNGNNNECCTPFINKGDD